MTFDQWWAKNAPRYYVSDPPPKKGWMVDVARDAWNAALEQRSARDFAPSETATNAAPQPTKGERLVNALREKADELPVEMFQQRGLMHMAADALANFHASSDKPVEGTPRTDALALMPRDPAVNPASARLTNALNLCAKLERELAETRAKYERLQQSAVGWQDRIAAAQGESDRWEDPRDTFGGFADASDDNSIERCAICKQEIHEFNAGCDAFNAGVKYSDLPDLPKDQNGVGWAWAWFLQNRPDIAKSATVAISTEMLDFLRGAGPLDGVWFGDGHPTYLGRYWWRSLLPDAPSTNDIPWRPE